MLVMGSDSEAPRQVRGICTEEKWQNSKENYMREPLVP